MDAEREAQIRAMSTEEVRRLLAYTGDDGAETDLILGLQTYADVLHNRGRATAFATHLATMTQAQRRRRVDMLLRCPHNCLLVEIYLHRPHAGGQLIYVIAHTRRGSKTFYANGGTADDGMDPDMYAPIACRHGAGQYVLVDAIDLVLFSGLPKGTNRRITDTVTLTFSSPGGPSVKETAVLDGPYAKWVAK